MARVLLIEDEDAQRLVASFALKKAGHEVEEASDGRRGVMAAMTRPPDVVVCDVMMPGMSGYEVVAALRVNPALANLPVILLTAMSDRQHMRQGMTAGADDYLTKPYKPAELCEAIDAVIARRQAQEQAFMSSVSGVVEDALEQQKEQLGRQYEDQLVREIGARWDSANAATDVAYESAFVLLADVLGADAAARLPNLAELVKQSHQSARDTFYLFGANHVLPYGTRLLAVFAGGEATLTTPVELRVLRAALALVKGAPRERPPTVALHAGPVTLVAVHDGLHGGQGHSVVPGDTVAAASSVNDAAAAQGWRIAITPGMASLLGERARYGQKTTTARGEEALELVAAST